MSMKICQKSEVFIRDKLEYLSGVCTAASEYRWSGHYSFLQPLGAAGPGVAGQYAAACGLTLIRNCILTGAYDLINFQCASTLSRSGVLYNTSELLRHMAF